MSANLTQIKYTCTYMYMYCIVQAFDQDIPTTNLTLTLYVTSFVENHYRYYAKNCAYCVQGMGVDSVVHTQPWDQF